MWGALGVLVTVIAVRILGPMVVESLDAHCVTWRYTGFILCGAALLGTVSYRSNSEVAVQFAVSIIPMMLVLAGVVAIVGVAYSQLQHEIPALVHARI
jgi:hypothetical protein